MISYCIEEQNHWNPSQRSFIRKKTLRSSHSNVLFEITPREKSDDIHFIGKNERKTVPIPYLRTTTIMTEGQ